MTEDTVYKKVCEHPGMRTYDLSVTTGIALSELDLHLAYLHDQGRVSMVDGKWVPAYRKLEFEARLDLRRKG